MIVAHYHKSAHLLTIRGHAYSGEPGHDLVCASASILGYTLASFVETSRRAHQVKKPVIRLEPGDTVIACRARGDNDAAISLVFDSICAGFLLLAQRYPENIVFNVIQ